VKFPLVILSHGSGGEYYNHTWLIDSLIENGFIVAALNHPMNTTRDNTDEGVISVWHRPRDISVLLDYLLNDSNWVNVIDENRIGAAGFSSGGYTVLALAGAIYDPELMSAYCTSQERGKDCELATDSSNVDFRDSSASYKDERIKSVFSMAPAVGSSITKESLAEIELPVFIIASKDDELVNPKQGAIRYAENIPLSDLVLLPSGGHFIFLECNAITAVVDWFNSELDLCGTKFNVDRDEIREMVSAKAVSFFNDNLLAVTP
jgi:predicted dienelactone hydrolase